MQLSRPLRTLASILAMLGVASSAAAEEGSGDWGGVIEPRLNYFWETSTRVVVPSFKARVDAPSGTRVGVGYLIDAITSASIAQTGSDEDQLFTEYRHGFALDITQALDFGPTQLEVGVNGTYSTEDDYKSYLVGADSRLTFNDKATTVGLAVTRIEDRIRANNDAGFLGELSGITLRGSVEHALNPTMLLTVAYQYGYLEGYLGNPYRRALVGPLPNREAPPEERKRHTGMMQLSWFIPETITAVHLVLSGYTDDWKMRAVTPEIRICQTFGRHFMVRPHYRFYRQSKAWFAQPSYPVEWKGPLTNDPKMYAMTTHTLGATFEYQLAFLADTILDFGKSARIDLTLSRYWNTNRFGNGIIGTAGARLEF